MYKILFPFLGFNSTLVQLKVISSGSRNNTVSRFNSTLVQLKVSDVEF